MSAEVQIIVSSAITLAALVVSAISVLVNRTNVITSAISSNRIEWIKDVRNLVYEFIQEYKNESEDKTKLKLISAHIMLYLNRSNDHYKDFVDALKACLTNAYSDRDCNALINATQEVLNSVWRRMKREAGVKRRYDAKISRILRNEVANSVDTFQFENAF